MYAAKGGSVPLFSIDEDKCRRDGLCALVCPAGLIKQSEPDAIPVPLEGKEQFCIRCGHCLAVCPHGAISLEAMAGEELEPVSRDLKISFEQARQFMKSRRSVRNFKLDPVSPEDIAKILDVARFAPSGHNDQPVEWLVLANRERVVAFLDHVVLWMREEMKERTELVRTMHLAAVVRAWTKGRDYICLDAPSLVMAHARTSDATTPDMDPVIATAWCDLAAHALGLGACWAGYITFAFRYKPELKKVLDIPEDHEVKGALMLGRPRIRFKSIPPRNPANVRFLE